MAQYIAFTYTGLDPSMGVPRFEVVYVGKRGQREGIVHDRSRERIERGDLPIADMATLLMNLVTYPSSLVERAVSRPDDHRFAHQGGYYSIRVGCRKAWEAYQAACTAKGDEHAKE